MIYDDAGNMVNKHAATLSQDIARQVYKLYETLFADGMTIVEARALLGYFKSEIDMTVTLYVLHQQMIGENNETN